MSTTDGTLLVTGATGFMGREIVRRLPHDGRRVIAVARSRSGESAAARFVPDDVDALRASHVDGPVARLNALAGARLARMVLDSEMAPDATPLESRRLRLIGGYREDLAQDVRFDDTCARHVLDRAGGAGLVRRALAADRIAG